jgi:hypothetical protein
MQLPLPQLLWDAALGGEQGLLLPGAIALLGGVGGGCARGVCCGGLHDDVQGGVLAQPFLVVRADACDGLYARIVSIYSNRCTNVLRREKFWQN